MTRTPRLARPAVIATVAGVAAALALPIGSATAAPSHGRSSRADLVARADGHASYRAAHGDAGVFFGTAPGHAATRPAEISASAASGDAAGKWLARYRSLFAQTGQLVQSRVEGARGGDSVVRFHQTVSGLPVVGGDLTVAMDADNQLLSVAGRTSPVSRVSTAAKVSQRSAELVAVRNVEKHAGRVTVKPTVRPTLSVFDPRVVPSPFLAAPSTVWDVTVASADSTTRHRVFVDATSAKIVADVNEDAQATRNVCQPTGYNGTANSERIADPSCPGADVTQRVTGSGTTDPAATGDPDVDNAYTFAKDVDNFYLNLLGRNSLDSHGMTLASTVHFCPPNDPNFPQATPCPYPNAFWDGKQMVYGDGYTAGLDVVGHEMTHGVTEHESNLLSYYQSGAINESESDVMGEMIQQIVGLSTNDTAVYDPNKAWQLGEALPGGPFRYMNDPTQDTPADPDSMISSHYNGYAFYQDFWDGGGVHANDGVGNKAAYLIAAGGALNGITVGGISGTNDVEKDVKVANIYYKLDHLMWSSTTYADLYNLLPQACNQLVGTTLNTPSGWTPSTTTISSSDCAQVVLAVKATKMNVLPTKSGAATPKPSPFCTNGGSASKKRLDVFETNPFSAGTYKRTHSTALDPFYGQREIGDWWWSKTKIGYYGSATPVFQKRGSSASLWGDDMDPTFVDPNQSTYSYEDARTQTTKAVKPALGTFLRFDHAWEFEYGPQFQGGRVKNFDGGRIEYTVDGGKTWYDAGAASKIDKKALIVTNGYNGTISNTTDLTIPYGDPNPLRGHRGFVQSSHGWTASRLDLSSLKGKSVLLRWRIGTDDVGGSYGWYVDNVEVYSCNPTTTSLTAPAKVVKGHHATLRAHVTRAGTTTALPGMPVQLWQRRHGTATWVKVGGAKLTNKFGTAVWSPVVKAATDFRVRMIGKKPFAPSNLAVATVRLS